jgi:hypothetical protein
MQNCKARTHHQSDRRSMIRISKNITDLDAGLVNLIQTSGGSHRPLSHWPKMPTACDARLQSWFFRAGVMLQMGLLASVLCWSVLWQVWSAAAVSAGNLIDLNKLPEEECSEGQLHLDTAIAAHHINEPIATGPSSFLIPSAIQIRSATKKRQTYDGQEVEFSRGPRKHIGPTSLAHAGYLDPSLSKGVFHLPLQKLIQDSESWHLYDSSSSTQGFIDDDHQLKPDHCSRIKSTTAPDHSVTPIPRIFEIDSQRCESPRWQRFASSWAYKEELIADLSSSSHYDKFSYKFRPLSRIFARVHTRIFVAT